MVVLHQRSMIGVRQLTHDLAKVFIADPRIKLTQRRLKTLHQHHIAVIRTLCTGLCILAGGNWRKTCTWYIGPTQPDQLGDGWLLYFEIFILKHHAARFFIRFVLQCLNDYLRALSVLMLIANSGIVIMD